jgi:hypothetical protein
LAEGVFYTLLDGTRKGLDDAQFQAAAIASHYVLIAAQ